MHHIDPIQIINNNFLYHSTFLQSQTPGMLVQHGEGVSYSDSGLSCDTFNILYINDHQKLTEKNFREALQHYNNKNFAFCIWINEENLSDRIIQLFKQAAVAEAGSDPGMILDLIQFHQLANDADIRRIDDPTTVAEYAHILSLNWTPPDEDVVRYFNQVADTVLNRQKHIQYYGSWMDGKLVSVIELFPDTKDNVGIYNVCTLTEYRGKGIATNLMKHCLQHLKLAGYKTATLQAADDGLNIYKKLGFKEATRFYEFKQ